MHDVNIVIFSKDRACQLDLLLQSIKAYWQINADIKILYRCTNDKYEEGYNRIIKEYDYELFREKDDFKDQFLSLQNRKSVCTMHLTDDDVFCDIVIKDDLYGRFVESNDLLCLTYRHGYDLCYNYEKGKLNKPEINNGEWEWRGKDVDWGYPMGYGHLYKTQDIYPLYANGQYDKAWNMECALAQWPINKSKMLCYKCAKMFNIPLNITQEGFKNKSGDIGLQYLNELYLRGSRLDLEKIISQQDRNTIYQERIELKWRS